MNLIRYSAVLLSLFLTIKAEAQSNTVTRERQKMDFDWKFAFGHPFDPQKDFNHATGYFSYLAKAGYGDGPAASDFDDRNWRTLDVPHDWAVEAPFDSKGSHSHGYKAVGRNFPERSVGWYRKSFEIPASDLGKRICIVFDGVSRDSKVWVNGFYLGTEPSGYSSFHYDMTDYLNYGGENVIAVRADVTLEEGWFYEGAGIYRHVWLTKTAPLHVAPYGTFITSEVNETSAELTVKTEIVNEGKGDETFTLSHTIFDPTGNIVAKSGEMESSLSILDAKEWVQTIEVKDPMLWSIETPHLYKAVTAIRQNGAVTDEYETVFGIRTIHFDADKGFFLNGKHVKLKGTNNHQDHAGVGTAMPDELQVFRIATLKSMGSNAYRTSHNPPTTELLDACDRMGMLVIDENRLMGTTPQVTDHLRRMIIRDRNHPSVIVWSIGNEEWAIEGNEKGMRIASSMQDFVKNIDTTRPVNAAISGGWGRGISTTIETMGYNYLTHGSTDEQHAKFPDQPGMGTEEGSTHATRGIYFADKERQYIPAYDKRPNSHFISIEEGWTHYAERDYLAGMFIWTGFDYRGESTPYGWPSVTSYFGMLDLCGFPKDNFYYLRSWWTDIPTLHILPHWNWSNKEGEEIDVWVYSNCDEAELFLNNKTLGKKSVKKNSHLEWKVTYTAGELKAVGYKNGRKTLTEVVKTAGKPSSIQLTPHKSLLLANREDIAVITVEITDNKKLFVPTANHEISFSIQGPGKIIGVGNGDPTSHEADRFLEEIETADIAGLKEKVPENTEAETAYDFDDSNWQPAFKNKTSGNAGETMVFRGTFELPENFSEADITLFYRSIATNQKIYINGEALTKDIADKSNKHDFKLDASMLRKGKNTIAITGIPLKKKHEWDNVNQNPGSIQLIFPSQQWQRKTFNGLAQVVVQSTDEPGEIVLTATSPDLKPATVNLASKK